MKQFDILLILNKMSSFATCDIKRALYRTSTLFVSALGRIHSVSDCSCFDIIDKLFGEDIVCNETKHKLLYIVSISCATRLKMYMKSKGQDDIVGNLLLNNDDTDLKEYNNVAEEVGEQSLGDCFIITKAFQNFLQQTSLVLSRISIPWNECEQQNFITIQICFCIKLYNRLSHEWKNYLNLRSSLQIDQLDRALCRYVAFSFQEQGKLEDAILVFEYLNMDTNDEPVERIIVKYRLCQCLLDLNRCEEANDHFIEAIKYLEDNFSNEHKIHPLLLRDFYAMHGMCMLELREYEKEIILLGKALQNLDFRTIENKESLFGVLAAVAYAEAQLGRTDKAILNMNIALILSLQQPHLKYFTVQCYEKLSDLYLKRKQYQESQTFRLAGHNYRLQGSSEIEIDLPALLRKRSLKKLQNQFEVDFGKVYDSLKAGNFHKTPTLYLVSVVTQQIYCCNQTN